MLYLYSIYEYLLIECPFRPVVFTRFTVLVGIITRTAVATVFRGKYSSLFLSVDPIEVPLYPENTPSKGKNLAGSPAVIQITPEAKRFVGETRKMFINGPWVEAASGKTLPVYDPAASD